MLPLIKVVVNKTCLKESKVGVDYSYKSMNFYKQHSCDNKDAENETTFDAMI